MTAAGGCIEVGEERVSFLPFPIPEGSEPVILSAAGAKDLLPSYGVPLRITGGRSVASAVATPAAVASFIPRFCASSSAARPSARRSEERRVGKECRARMAAEEFDTQVR